MCIFENLFLINHSYMIERKHDVCAKVHGVTWRHEVWYMEVTTSEESSLRNKDLFIKPKLKVFMLCIRH